MASRDVLSEVVEPLLPPRLGEVLLLLRKRKGWTLKQLQEATGMPESTLSRYERGVHEPTVGALRKIAVALDTDPGEIVNATRPKLNGQSPRSLRDVSYLGRSPRMERPALAASTS